MECLVPLYLEVRWTKRFYTKELFFWCKMPYFTMILSIEGKDKVMSTDIGHASTRLLLPLTNPIPIDVLRRGVQNR